MRWRAALPLLLLAACSKPAPSQPTPVQSVSVAPRSTTSPNDPVLLVGPQKPIEPSLGTDVERVNVKDDEPDMGWKPPREQCPDGVTEMMSVHLKLGETMELPQGAAPVSALGRTPDALDVTFDRARKVVRVTARKYGLLFVLTQRDRHCTWYGVNSGY